MGNFNIMGSYSGIDMSVIDQMIEAEKAKGVQFTNRKDKIEREQGAWKDVGTRLTSLGQKTDVLSRRGTFESRTVKSSATGNAAVSVTAGNSAPVGDYRIQVKQLATSSRLTGNKINLDFTDISEAEKKKNPLDRKMGLTDSFKFRNADGKAFEIQVKADDSLRKITENINKETKESGIRASVVDNRLILTDTKMGARDIAVEFSGATKDTAVELGFKPTASRLTGNKANLDSISDLIPAGEAGAGVEFQFGRDNNQQFSINIGQDDDLESIAKEINKLNADSEGVEKTGIEASIMDGRLILTDTNSTSGKLVVSNDDVSNALGFYENTTITGAEISNKVNIKELAGGFTITNADGEELKIDISEVAHLRNIADEINTVMQTNNERITASIKNGRLVLTGNGARDITITDGEGGVAEKLGLTTGSNKVIGMETNGVAAVTTTENSSIGQGAIFTIDGLEIERNTNRISDAIEGMAFTLSSVHAEGQSELISVTNNTQKGVDAVKEFVDQYNSVMNFIQTQTDVGTPTEDNNTTGALVGEGSIMRLQSGLRSLLTSRIGGNSDIKAASDLGITTDRYGVASLDEAKLAEVLREDPESVARFFYKPEAADVESTEPAGRSVDSTKGMSELFENLIETYTARSKGIISTKNASYERMVKQINEQIETFNERIDRKRDRYIKQFAALDEAMMRAESQMEYLWSQMNIE